MTRVIAVGLWNRKFRWSSERRSLKRLISSLRWAPNECQIKRTKQNKKSKMVVQNRCCFRFSDSNFNFNLSLSIYALCLHLKARCCRDLSLSSLILVKSFYSRWSLIANTFTEYSVNIILRFLCEIQKWKQNAIAVLQPLECKQIIWRRSSGWRGWVRVFRPFRVQNYFKIEPRKRQYPQDIIQSKR